MIDTHDSKCFSGFTLVELLVTVSILGILAVMATVNLSSSWTRNRLLSTTVDLENWLTSQRRYAINHNLTCRIIIDYSNKRLESIIDSETNETEPCLNPSGTTNATIFDLDESFGDGNKKLTFSATSLDPDEKSIIRLQHQGFSQHHLLDANEELTDANLDNEILELRLAHQDLPRQRCIRFISPIGMTRNGITDGASSTSKCRYDKTY